MPARQYRSTVEAKTLSAGINNSVTSMTLNSVTTLPSTYPYTLVIDPDIATEEIVTVTASGGGNTLTITRGQDGTSAQAHNSAAAVKHMITARDLQEPQDHIAASSAIHGVTGSVVGTTDTQTLTNKTITGGTVNPTTLQQNSVAVVTISGTQTLTNKTLTSPKVNEDVAVTATATELNILDGVTTSTAELNYVNGVTSAIQTQLNTLTSNVALKAPLSPATNAQTGTSYTLVLSDAGKYVEMNNASNNTLTVPHNDNVAFPIGTEITVIQTGAGKTTIGFASNVVINYYSNTAAATSSIKAQWSAATLIKRATNTWVLIGNLT